MKKRLSLPAQSLGPSSECLIATQSPPFSGTRQALTARKLPVGFKGRKLPVGNRPTCEHSA